MTKITGEWIKEKAAQAVCRAISDAGFQIYFVGGCVRNDLLGVPISDLDLSTNALPEQVMKIAKDAGFRAVPTGIEHGTITIVHDGEGFEITSFRKDVQTDGRRAVVAFSGNIEDDARRRDFTINALYASPDGHIVDPLGGLPDLAARRIRFIDNASDRIREDYLRTLRFFRFYAWYADPNAGIDCEGLAAIAQNLSGLQQLSKERVGVEILKLLFAPNPSEAVASMVQSGVMSAIFPGADSTNLPILVHLEQEHHPDAIRRLAALGGDDVADRLRLSKRDQKKLHLLRDEMGRLTPPAELAYWHGAKIATDVVLLRASQMGVPVEPDKWAQIEAGAAAQFPVTAKDLMTDFSGKALGEKLKQLEATWIASGFTLTRKELLT